MLERGMYSAAPQAIGYIYQFQYALLNSLKRLRDGSEFSLCIESLDDLVFQKNDKIIDVIQTKHSQGRVISDTSADLWKTLRIWIDIILLDNSLESSFYFVTNSKCNDGSILGFIKDGSLDNAYRKLEQVALTSKNAKNKECYEKFLSIPVQLRLKLIESIYINDESPDIEGIEKEIIKELYYSVDKEFLQPLYQRLEGWWIIKVVDALNSGDVTYITSDEINFELSRLRSQFQRDNLPIDKDILKMAVDSIDYEEHMFVKQLDLIKVSPIRITHAIRNFFRASELRSRWMREDLLHVGELSNYERMLTEEWELMFAHMQDSLGCSSDDESKQQAANTLYHWAETGSHQKLRRQVDEPCVARGTYQILADNMSVGWHADYKAILKQQSDDDDDCRNLA